LCDYYHKVINRNIIKRGKTRAGHQQYQCLHCGKVFSETTNGVLFHKHLQEKDIQEIMDLLSKGNGNRSISRITGHDRGTISIYLECFVMNAEWVNSYLFTVVKMPRSQIVQFWITVKKNRNRFSKDAQYQLEMIIEKNNIKLDTSVNVN
jgi:hypothetical protein